MLSLTALHIYPVKGLKGLDLGEADVEPWGLAQDRRWMIVDAQGRFISQRQDPRLALIEPRLGPHGLRLSFAASGTIAVAEPPPDAERLDVVVWRDRVSAVAAGREADLWLLDVLGRPCRLVHMDAPERARPVDPAFGLAGDRVSFADGFPMLATTQASLDDLNGRLSQPVPMNRFRPNIVIGGGEAWGEDHWHTLRVGAVDFRAAKPCGRCVVTTIDQRTAEKSPMQEPIRTLATFRRGHDGDIIFGQNLVPDRRGTLRVGDPVVAACQV